jgi:hypothetical protein
MPKITVEHETSLPITETFKKVQEYLEHSEGLRKLDSDLKCTFDEAGQKAHVKGSKFEAAVSFNEIGGGKTKVVFEVEVGFLLTPFKGKIFDTLKEKMTKILG